VAKITFQRADRQCSTHDFLADIAVAGPHDDVQVTVGDESGHLLAIGPKACMQPMTLVTSRREKPAVVGLLKVPPMRERQFV